MEYIGNDLQVELGTQATAFEEYVEPAYYNVKFDVYFDGIAEGIMSISPSMTLIVDTENVGSNVKSIDFELEAEYNKDTNKVIETLTDETTALKDQWRLINEVTLGKNAVVEFTADKGGNAFNLKKFKITVLMPQLASQLKLWLFVGEFTGDYYPAVRSESIATSATQPTVSIMGERTYAWQFETCYSSSGLKNSGQVYSFPKGSHCTEDITGSLCKIKIALNSSATTPLPSGSKIKLWGCE
jgi:hypothetical protein